MLVFTLEAARLKRTRQVTFLSATMLSCVVSSMSSDFDKSVVPSSWFSSFVGVCVVVGSNGDAAAAAAAAGSINGED